MAEASRDQDDLGNALLKEAQAIISQQELSEEDYIKDTMNFYMKEKRRLELIEDLKKGYIEMSRINLELAESGFEQDLRDLDSYEDYVGEMM